jgi:hypothetical protein
MDRTRAQITFLRKFAHFYDSGIALAEALDLARADIGGDLAEAIAAVLEDIYRGNSLADALEARPQCFSVDIVALIRAGEQRGDLSGAARSAADGLGGGVLDATATFDDDVEALLMLAGDAHVVHVAPDGTVRVREGGALRRLEELARGGTIEGLLHRAARSGAFLWEDRLVRVAAAGEAVVLHISGAAPEEPAAARAWRASHGGLLLLHGDRHADFDAPLRAIADAFDPETSIRVGVDFPIPGLLHASDVEGALHLDPDVLLVCRFDARDVERIGNACEAGVRVVVATTSARAFEKFDPEICAI